MRITNQNLLDNASIKDCIETLCTPDGVGIKMKQAILDKYTQKIIEKIRAEKQDPKHERTS